MDASADGRSLIRRYYLYRATLSVGFITPVFTLFLLRSLTFTQFGALSALYSVLAVAGELPTGYVGDRFGRRASLLLSVAFTVSSLAGFVVVDGFLAYAVLYALWALALTFRSGSKDAWLYDVLDDRLDAARFSHVRGRGDAVQGWTGAVTMVAGGLLYGLDPTAPFVAAVAFNSLGFVALFSLPKNSQYADGSDEEASRLGLREAVEVFRTDLLRPRLRALVLYVGLFYAVVGVAAGYLQPMAVETLAPYASGFGVEVSAADAMAAARRGEAGGGIALGLGVLYAALAAVSSMGGYYAGALEARLGVRRAVVLVPAATAVAFVLPLGVALLALPTFAAMRTGRPLIEPIATGFINDHVGSVGRATVLSAVSMITLLVRTPLAIGAGVLADASSATAGIAALGACFLAVGGAVWLLGEIAPESA
jgi:MFS family permease